MVKCNELIKKTQEFISTEEELIISYFLFIEIKSYLKRIENLDFATSSLLNEYHIVIDEVYGIAYLRRRQVEKSMQTINWEHGKYFDSFRIELQNYFPCYLETFRTDGIEYDIYAGQSITPDRTFSIENLHQFRLMQLKSMIAVTKLTTEMYHNFEYPLKTTQLILVNSRSIDMYFRDDEKRFDMEGAYNISYQVIKKRIDKANIKNSGERLTQPHKIVIVYLNEQVMTEFVGYIETLQNQHLLNHDLEYLELEELQGIPT